MIEFLLSNMLKNPWFLTPSSGESTSRGSRACWTVMIRWALEPLVGPLDLTSGGDTIVRSTLSCQREQEKPGSQKCHQQYQVDMCYQRLLRWKQPRGQQKINVSMCSARQDDPSYLNDVTLHVSKLSLMLLKFQKTVMIYTDGLPGPYFWWRSHAAPTADFM